VTYRARSALAPAIVPGLNVGLVTANGGATRIAPKRRPVSGRRSPCTNYSFSALPRLLIDLVSSVSIARELCKIWLFSKVCNCTARFTPPTMSFIKSAKDHRMVAGEIKQNLVEHRDGGHWSFPIFSCYRKSSQSLVSPNIEAIENFLALSIDQIGRLHQPFPC
jgi:hypothetical protein